MHILFRPHHFMCALGFQGKGYSPAFINNFQNIMNQLNSPGGGDIPISITPYTDTICAPCPHRQDKSCDKQSLISTLDQAHASALDLTTASITWTEAKLRIKERITVDVFHNICEGCNWKSLGVCEAALNLLHKS